MEPPYAPFVPPQRRLDPDTILATDALFLTANNRQARQLRLRLEARLAAAGPLVWESPRVLPWSTWLSLAHRELVDLGYARDVPLSRAQERLVWEDVIERSTVGGGLLRRGPAAATAAAAYRLLLEWRLPRPEVRAFATPETEAFLAWTEDFEQRCAEHRWLAAAALPARLTDALAQGRLPAPGRLLLVGFDEYNPTQSHLLATLQGAGVTVEALADSGPATVPQRVAAADARDEILTAARWARDRVRADPEARIGIAVPDLAARRAAIADGLTRVLQPESLAPDAEPAAPLFEFSLGPPLADCPVVHDALLALALPCGERSLLEVSRLLRSPFFAGAETEWAARGALDARLREDRRPTLSLGHALATAERATPESACHCPAWTAALGRVRALAAAGPTRAAPSRWAVHFDQLLAALGWPGERSLDSAEYQTVQRFRELLAEFAATDRFAGICARVDAVALLRTLAAETPFQPEGTDAPVQVLGMLEAGGLQFDGLWVMGLGDEHWPAPAAPNPLLPALLQRRYGLPHASSEREQLFARRLLERLLASTPHAVVSHPAREGDRELRASPLIVGYPMIDVTTGMPPDPWATAPAAVLEAVPDRSAPPPGGAPRGGTQILSAQALCPFRAVAAHRLNATTLEAPSHAPDARIVGQLVHSALEQLWRAIGDSRRLRAMPEAERTAAASAAAATALAEAVRQRPDLFGANLQRLERERLTDLLLAWLELEGARAPFTVERLETEAMVALGGLELRIRGDRVDRLDDGRLVVIDYKTGPNAAPGDWTGARPTEPQVPLYSIASTEPVAAAVIARVRNGRMGWLGVAEQDGLLPGVPAFDGRAADIDDWPALLRLWRLRLQALAVEIRAGHAPATPSPAACTYCPYPGLCRLNEAAGGPAAATDDGTE